jgi:23S rRNA-/tRNA-specific pseudouridylate synthase
MLTELFRDSRFVIIDKPAGLPVHPGPSRTPSVEDLFPTLTRKKHGPWLAHRLDADTSGCLAIALSKTALLAAQSAFATGRTHQVRAHCAAIGTPILHDPIYGPASTPATLCLLARRLVLPLDPPAAATAPVPPHMQAILNAHPGLS